MNNQDAMMSSARNGGAGKDTWETAPWLVTGLKRIFPLNGDAAADVHNHLFPRWMGPGSSLAADALAVPWSGELGSQLPFWWLNNPYSLQDEFSRKSHAEALAGNAATLMLCAGRPDVAWFHDLVYHRTDPRSLQRVFVGHLFIQSRLRFTDPYSEKESTRLGKEPATFPSMLVVFAPINWYRALNLPELARLHIHGTKGITRKSDMGIWETIATPPGYKEKKRVETAGADPNADGARQPVGRTGIAGTLEAAG